MTFSYDLRLIYYVFTKYDEPFKTKIQELSRYYKWRFNQILGRYDIKDVGIEIEGGWN